MSGVGPCCPWCLSMDPNMVGVERATGMTCRDPFHCPSPESHSDQGGPFRFCQWCNWREEPSEELSAGCGDFSHKGDCEVQGA